MFQRTELPLKRGSSLPVISVVFTLQYQLLTCNTAVLREPTTLVGWVIVTENTIISDQAQIIKTKIFEPMMSERLVLEVQL